ncbi:MAG: glycerophosphodiester phosphodiesterase [Hyphomicrobiaceae bacterium]|nr:glycerophosphodiester phosphodiesterase [Hyphomicrobiaceae bacterium]
MLLRESFLRPIAHRGLHDAAVGRLENTAPAFEAAIAAGFGIECDLRPAGDGTPFVFHDAILGRLVDAAGPIASRSPAELSALRYREQDTPILSYSALLELTAGKAPLLVEIKSDWDAPDPRFLSAVAELSMQYRGPIALKSFDPAVMTAMRALAPDVPRGIVAGIYDGPHWWPDRIGPERAFRLSHCLEAGPAEPSFISYDVDCLPTPVTRFAREVMRLPLFAWTVRNSEQLKRAAAWADAPIFEGCDPVLA